MNNKFIKFCNKNNYNSILYVDPSSIDELIRDYNNSKFNIIAIGQKNFVHSFYVRDDINKISKLWSKNSWDMIFIPNIENNKIKNLNNFINSCLLVSKFGLWINLPENHYFLINVKHE
jgi:hypothetical protein